ncbi:T9SS type A sorting domain-containing protein [Bernardetia litoralis]|uniref:T9SS type A sorting domain-containing protein n=1 Tax=Bernardetia litoralis TaxID=999 RepID=UPI0002EE7B53|nr:T9SS type A sorting domain-containing protein [Bernardetia litoralis]
MKSNQLLSTLKKLPQQPSLSIKSLTKSFLVAIVFFMAVSYSSFSYSQNLQAIASTTDGINKVEISEAYPNPAVNFVQFDYRIADKISEGKITVYNLLGSVIGSYNLNNYKNRIQIPVDNLKAGIYFYTISVNNKSLITKKFIVKH